MPGKNIEDLNYLFKEAEDKDRLIFAEQRSNVLLKGGDHYAKKESRFWYRLRNSKDISQEQKIRLTKNHVQKIVKTYVNNIIMHSPGVTMIARNEKEPQDQKAAELSLAVWEYLKDKNKWDVNLVHWVDHYITTGELALKNYWDPTAGNLIGFKPKLDDNGDFVEDRNGNVAPGAPVFTGLPRWEPILSFNLLRHPDARTMDDSSVLIVRKMINVKELKNRIGDDPDRLEMITAGQDSTFLVFEGSTGRYHKSKTEIMLKEYYYRACTEYPFGYYYITVDDGILWEGPLPFGIYPIHYVGFDEIETCPRHRSIIKQIRPYQAEINRASSKIAEHQITLGDDKLIISSGSKISHGGQVPGVRAIKVAGTPPTILHGRTGEQYMNYLEQNIREMYAVANVAEDSRETQGQIDPYTLLFKSIKEKKRFLPYAIKFQSFLKELAETSLELMRQYAQDDMLIQSIGRHEAINIREFKQTTPLGYMIKIEDQSDDIETKMGKQLTYNHILQYVGPQLKKEDIGKLIRLMPYANSEKMSEDFTMDYDMATNDILAMDRGEMPEINQSDNHEYLIKKIVSRTKQSDFKFMPEQIKQIYKRYKIMHQQFAIENLKRIKAIESEFIPTGGYLVTLDFYVNNPNKPNTTRRARIPYESIQWLLKTLERQGHTMESFESMDANQRAGLAQQAIQELRASSEKPGAGLSLQSSGNHARMLPGAPSPERIV